MIENALTARCARCYPRSFTFCVALPDRSIVWWFKIRVSRVIRVTVVLCGPDLTVERCND
jgi:hypothetical protein